ncbi:YaaC family protein [Burkholderia gladioli]|uniref:YaaC family protein n=1 Tax=Burkholderia gladioli TaxID=28095 RepID=UPI003F7ABB2B
MNQKIVPFSFWPMHEAHRGRHRLQSVLFSLDPWAVIIQRVHGTCPASAKDEALACIAQARDFFLSAEQAGALEARPLLQYYSYMNLVKAFCLTRGTRTTFDRARHGLSEKLSGPNFRELADAHLEAEAGSATNQTAKNFSEFLLALTGSGLAANTRYNVPELLPQIVPGHRLWAEAANQDERFIHIHDIHFMRDHVAREIWLQIYVVAEDLARLHVTRIDLINSSGIQFHEVQTSKTHDGKKLICFESNVPMPYVGYAADKLNALAEQIKSSLWTTVSTVKPFRRYYLYRCPAPEQPAKLPQLLSIYALSFYLGSITRYRPHQYPKIVRGEFGPRVQDFITGQPQQFLYLIASEFAKQELAKPAIV